MNVLVTGGTQPLGIRLAEILLERGDGVVLVGREERSTLSLPADAVYERIDLRRTRHVRKLLGAHEVDAIVHLAHHRRAGRGNRRLNVGATRNLLRVAEAHGVPRFVHRSTAEVYLVRNHVPDVLREDQPLNLHPGAPAWIRHRVEADVTVSTRMGLVPSMRIAVLRCAEILAPEMGSQLYDFLSSRICLRPMGFDPVLNVLSLDDGARAFALALDVDAEGAFNVPGADTLSLSLLIERWGRDEIPLPGPLLGPAYELRRMLRGKTFDYEANRWRFHFNGILDGSRARDVLGYTPSVHVDFPR